MLLQAIEVVDSDVTSSKSSVSPSSAGETTPDTSELVSDRVHRASEPAARLAAVTAADVQLDDFQNTDHCGLREQGTILSRQASEPYTAHQGFPSLRTDDETDIMKDLNVVDAARNSIEDCLVTSLRAEVS